MYDALLGGLSYMLVVDIKLHLFRKLVVGSPLLQDLTQDMINQLVMLVTAPTVTITTADKTPVKQRSVIQSTTTVTGALMMQTPQWSANASGHLTMMLMGMVTPTSL